MTLASDWPLIATSRGRFRSLQSGPLLCPGGPENARIVELLLKCGVDVIDCQMTTLPQDFEHKTVYNCSPESVTDLLQHPVHLDALSPAERKDLLLFLTKVAVSLSHVGKHSFVGRIEVGKDHTLATFSSHWTTWLHQVGAACAQRTTVGWC